MATLGERQWEPCPPRIPGTARNVLKVCDKDVNLFAKKPFLSCGFMKIFKAYTTILRGREFFSRITAITRRGGILSLTWVFFLPVTEKNRSFFPVDGGAFFVVDIISIKVVLRRLRDRKRTSSYGLVKQLRNRNTRR